jgi:hypothetical protein
MTYPSTVTAFTNPTATNRLNAPSHSSIEVAQNTGLTEIQTFVGTLSSTQGTLMYDIRSSGSNGGGHVQTANVGGTGQTSFNKGDVLVASSSSVLTKLAVTTTDGFALVADSAAATGVKWGVPHSRPTIRVYTSSVATIWNKPSTLAYIVIEAVGGGGASAGRTSSGPGGTGGGGAGAYALKVVPASSLPVAASVVAGAGGLGSRGTIGSIGGISYFGSILTTYGGQGGNTASGGVGGSVLSGDININGGSGANGAGVTGFNLGGKGGDSPLGFGGSQTVLDGAGAVPGNLGQLYGGGASGGATQDTTDVDGNHGAAGVVIVYEY